MKIMFVFMAILVSFAAHAADYTCTDREGHEALLSINGTSVAWSEPCHSAESGGVYRGIETAPYIGWTGYGLYQLQDFYQTNDSAYYLALESAEANKMRAISFFDNDDHAEEIAKYSCVKN